MPSVAHLTCVSSTRDTVHNMIEKIRAAGIQNVMALRGDLTDELKESDRSNWDYRHAVDLVRELKDGGCGFLYRRRVLSRGSSRKRESKRGYKVS